MHPIELSSKTDWQWIIFDTKDIHESVPIIKKINIAQ